MRLDFLLKSKFIIEPNFKSSFLTLRAKLVFISLRQKSIKISILYFFDIKDCIWLKTYVFGYIINKVLSQLTSNNLGQWYFLVFFFRKIILT